MTVRVGDAIAGAAILVRPEAMKLWSVVLRDPNPIHLDPEVVRAKGLGDRVINQGPANVAYVVNALLQAFSGGRLEHLTVRFLDNVYEGEHVFVAGKVTQVDVTDNGQRVRCETTLSSDGRLVLSAEALLLAPVLSESIAG
jgi:3-hydroxybutyryl-CoA dehydratase